MSQIFLTPSEQRKIANNKYFNTPKEKEVTPKKKQETKPVVTKPKEKTEAEKRAEEERAAAQAAANKIAGAFGKGSKMGSKGSATSGQGIEGSPDGNGNTGKTSGVGGYGTFDLNGRSLGPGGLRKLPKLAY